jgi:chromosome segregation and condensation protein ScpB
VERAVVADTLPRLAQSHMEVVAIAVHAGAVTRKRIDEVCGVDSAETVAQLVEWGCCVVRARRAALPSTAPPPSYWR